MIEIGIIALFVPLVTSMALTYRFIKVKSINKKIKQILTNKNSPMARKISQELGLGATFIGSSVFDIYTATRTNEDVLDVIEQRYPKEMGDASTIDWINKASEGENTIQNYKTAYVGEKAEVDAMERLKELGYSEIEQFSSKTHSDNDIKALDPQGNEVSFSVKSYSDVNSLKSAIKDHPDSKNYIVNDELYNKLDASGDLAEYKLNGIEISNGKYSHLENTKEVEGAFGDLESSTNVIDDVGVVAIAFLGIKTTMNIKNYFQGKQSAGEFRANLGGDVVGVGTRGVGMYLGAKIGTAIGTGFLPGVGTVAGGIVGGIIGGISGGELAEDLKENMKWGDIINSTEYFGKKYATFFNNYKKRTHKEKYSYSSNAILKKICHLDKAKDQLQRDKQNLKKSSTFMSRIGISPRTLKESLFILHIRGLKKYLKKSSKNIDVCFENINLIISEAKNKLPKEDKDRGVKIYRCIGELVLENREFFINTEKLNNNEKKILQAYDKQLKKNPNHPYKLFEKSNKTITEVLRRSMATDFIKA